MPRHNEERRPVSSIRLAALIVTALIAVAALAIAPPPAHAQQVDDSLPRLADLTITSPIPGLHADRWHVTVKNNTVGTHPGVHVHLVKVLITLWDPVRGTSTRMWAIRDLPPGGSQVRRIFALFNNPKATDEPRFVAQRLYAEIIESVPVESPRFRFNNTTENWVIEDRQQGSGLAGETYFAIGDVALDVAGISDRLPQAGGATTFTVALPNDPDRLPNLDIPAARQSKWVFDVQVEISLSPGLSFAATQPEAATGTTFVASTGIWNVGATDSSVGPSLPVAVNLTADSLADLPLQERCLTAKVVNAVPWFANDPRLANDTATACLGAAPVSSGTMELIEFYPCISATSTPCTSEATLELVVDLGESVQQPEAFIFHIPDPGGRFTSTRHGRVIWSTANLMDLRESQTRLTKDWHIRESVKVTAPGGGNAPGRWLLTNTDDSVANNFDILNATTTETVTFDLYHLLDSGTDPTQYFLDVKVDFWALGTYKALLGIFGRLSGTTYSDSATYIFHVGPIADLEVRDGGPHAGLASTQRAFSILAVNNGPDDAPAAQVTVTGLNASDYVSHTATAGTFNSGTGVWTIGELRESGYFQDIYARDGEVLTIITSAAVDTEINAAITNTQDYQVCIDSSGNDVATTTSAACTNEDATNTWHTTDYYDYIPGNSTTTIKAKDGTGADLPALQSPRADTASIVVTWDAVTEVNERPVTHYEVQRQTNPWVTVATTTVATTEYVDTDVAPGDTFQYRVRAVNDWDQKGPWSTPMEGTVPEPEVITNTETVFRDRVVTVTETVTETVSAGETPFARFASTETSRRVAENSAPGTPVGAPVAVERNSGNSIAYSLEGADAALFEIERDSGQILVGHGTLLDYESDRIRYVVEVVAEPRLSSTVRTTVHIRLVDVAESATVSISPAGQPQVGQALTATLTHGGGEPVDPRWQWHRSAGDGLWSGIQGATSTAYTPTERDAGRRLRAIVTYGEPDGSGDGVAGAITQALPGDPHMGAAALYDANGDGRIDLGEVIAAIRDYYAGDLDFVGVMEVIGVYYAG